MLNHKKRIVNLIEKYQQRKEKSFEQFNCLERPLLFLCAIDVGIPLSQFEKYVAVLKAFEIISEFTQNFKFAGYVFNEKKYNEFKKE